MTLSCHSITLYSKIEWREKTVKSLQVLRFRQPQLANAGVFTPYPQSFSFGEYIWHALQGYADLSPYVSVADRIG